MQAGVLWRLLGVIVLLVASSISSQPAPVGSQAPVGSVTFRETFDGEPSSPQRWNSANWDVTTHTRSAVSSFDPMQAHHGPDCGPPPATHAVSAYEDAVYLCRNHLMTAINGGDYGAVYLTPNHLVDFSQGEAVIRFDLSTLRTSERDWVDIWVTPYEDNLQFPLFDWLPDLQGEPRRAIHISMDKTNEHTMFRLMRIDNFNTVDVEGGKLFTGYETFLTPSATRRDTFELRISRNRIRFGMPQYNFWWHDVAIPDLGWSQGVVQLGHHSYTPDKCTGCTPNTWHWDNVEISPARPFTLLKADQRVVDASTDNEVRFNGAAPAGARLRFAAIGGKIEVSTDGGRSWQLAQAQAQQLNNSGHFRSYWTPVPAGTDRVLIRGQDKNDWYGGPWMVRDISIWHSDVPLSPVGGPKTERVFLPFVVGRR